MSETLRDRAEREAKAATSRAGWAALGWAGQSRLINRIESLLAATAPTLKCDNCGQRHAVGTAHPEASQ